ncbi:MAG: MFS transporter [Anaerolineaceae bacterium]|jgi:MFS family permease
MPLKPEAEKASFFQAYAGRLKLFSRNAKLYLASAVLFGIASGILNLLFNFFMLSMGYNEAVIGTLVTIRSSTSLLLALPLGYLTDRIGRKQAFFWGYLAVAFAVGMIILFPKLGLLYTMNVVMGAGQALSMVAMGPFLMENSHEEERTYLFSFASGISTVAGSIGQWIGGYLPGWFGKLFSVDPSSPTAYAWSLGTMVVIALFALIPNLMMVKKVSSDTDRSDFAPLAFMKSNPGSLSKLILPLLMTSIGAGMIMPFMNVFFRNVHHQADATIGVMFAWGSLAMGIGLLIAPVLAERYGKIQVVVITQTLSIPFLIVLGFSPVFVLSLGAYYLRVMLMNMSSPVYSTYVMERVDTRHRAMVASLTSMAGQFGWAISPTISGMLQVKYGFQPSFAITISLYVISISMYYAWHMRKKFIGFQNIETSEDKPGAEVFNK